MVANVTTERSEGRASEPRDQGREHARERTDDKSLVRHVETEPQSDSAKILAVGATVPLGLAAAALATTLLSKQERVAIAAWVAVAVVGSASVVSAAAVSHRRVVSVDRENHGTKSADHLRGSSRNQPD